MDIWGEIMIGMGYGFFYVTFKDRKYFQIEESTARG